MTPDKVDLGDLVRQADLRHYATKEDLANLKVWIVSTGFFAVAAIAGLVIAVVRLWK